MNAGIKNEIHTFIQIFGNNTMKFCPVCRNMLYGIDEDVVDGEKTAVLSCRKCSYKQPISRENPIVYEHVLRQETSTTLALNPYLKFDPTLEHLTNVICPNAECPTKTERAPPDVVPVEIDSKKLIWMYQCTLCSNTWTQSSRAS